MIKTKELSKVLDTAQCWLERVAGYGCSTRDSQMSMAKIGDLLLLPVSLMEVPPEPYQPPALPT
jgi:hypothetical protein